MAATMTTSTFATLRIRFIEDDDHPSNDEWIRIVPIHNQNATAFGQEYKITSNLGGVEHTSSVQCSNILVQYVSNILRLVAVDDAPCKRIQFDIPHVPSVLITSNHLKNRIPEVVALLVQTTQSWPRQGNTLPSVFANINWNSTATPARPFVSPDPIIIPPPPFNWNSPAFRTPERVNRHMYFDDDGNEVIDLTQDSE
jgi:hypothetical protein